MSYLVEIDASNRVASLSPVPATLPTNLGLQGDGSYLLLVSNSTVGPDPSAFALQSVFNPTNETFTNHGPSPSSFGTLTATGWEVNRTALLEAIRIRRNQLLRDSDWTHAVSDHELTTEEIAEYTVYRQALRGLTDNLNLNGINEVEDITFPTKPGGS